MIKSASLIVWMGGALLLVLLLPLLSWRHTDILNHFSSGTPVPVVRQLHKTGQRINRRN